MDAQIASQSAMMMAQSQPLKAPAATGNAAVAGKAAKEFESVFISQFLGSMFSGISTDGPTGGGEGEEMFRSLMIDQYGKSVEQRGGFGLAAAVQRQLLKHQEAAPQAGDDSTPAQAADQAGASQTKTSQIAVGQTAAAMPIATTVASTAYNKMAAAPETVH